MPEVGLFVKQLLEEDEFGTEFHANIQERVGQLNLPQLTKMHAHLYETAATAQFHIWREANEVVEGHYSGMLAIRQDEFNKVERDRQERAKKLEFRRLRKEALKKEEEKVKGFLENHCKKLAAEQIHEEEKTRKAEERARIRLLVYKNERKRYRLLAAALAVLILGIAVGVVLFRDTLLMMATIIAGAMFIAGVIVVFTIITTRLVVHESTGKQLGKLISQRTIELQFEAENELIRKEEAFNHKQLADREERRVRKRALREQRELERQIAEMDREERMLQGLDSEYSLASGSLSTSPPRRLPPINHPRYPNVHAHPNPHMQGSMATMNTHGTQGGTLGSEHDLGVGDSQSLWPRQSSGDESDDDDDDDEDYGGAVVMGESLTLGGVGSQSASTLGGVANGGSGVLGGRTALSHANASFNSRDSFGMHGAVAGGGASFSGSMSNLLRTGTGSGSGAGLGSGVGGGPGSGSGAVDHSLVLDDFDDLEGVIEEGEEDDEDGGSYEDEDDDEDDDDDIDGARLGNNSV